MFQSTELKKPSKKPLEVEYPFSKAAIRPISLVSLSSNDYRTVHEETLVQGENSAQELPIAAGIRGIPKTRQVQRLSHEPREIGKLERSSNEHFSGNRL